MKSSVLFLVSFLYVNLGLSNEPQEHSWSSEDHFLDYSQANEVGVELFYQAQFLKGLENFTLVIQGYQEGGASEIEYGMALWGKALCDAALNHVEDFEEDINAIRLFFLEKYEDTYLEVDPLFTPLLASHHDHSWFDRPQGQKAPDVSPKFADPNEQVSIQGCIDRVKTTANILKGAITTLKRRDVILALNNLIDDVSRAGVRCCASGQLWTTCVSPIIQMFNKWKLFGVPDDPNWG